MEVESGGDFEQWLCLKLKHLGLDEEVFGSYVTGVLDEEDSNDDDRQEALVGILDGMTEAPVEEVSDEILSRWKISRADVIKKRQLDKEQEVADKRNKLAQIMEKQASTLSTAKPAKQVDAELKRKLLNEYGHQSEEENYSDSEDEVETLEARVPPRLTGNEQDLFKNTNSQAVQEKEREKREKEKKESEQKKQQIKDAKEKQKQKNDDRKEKEKKRTQKGERRR
ncbi:coiled-coil domain-containing protein 43-like [Actinia tenebrosa]|uniref:Coiled-coil domain-containing protein 43 n=1 Tax=Actinia tenebrosa TaxID=6105 RepID=A0A6P8HGC0_ACTTE|nr:coiled-coil domain-containing protein 43-like [Actinia tenebrosa]